MFKKLKNNKGQALVEYMILVALIAIVAIGAVKVVGQNITAQFANISEALHGGTQARSLEKVDQNTYKNTKNLGNFMGGSNGGK